MASNNGKRGHLIHPPNIMKKKLGGGLPKLDRKLIGRAERAVESLKDDFDNWLNDEILELQTISAQYRDNPSDKNLGDALFICAHDLRGLGGTYSYPVITRLATSLSKLTEHAEIRAKVPYSLIEAHINAIRAAVAQNIKTDDAGVAASLSEELEQQTRRIVGGSEL